MERGLACWSNGCTGLLPVSVAKHLQIAATAPVPEKRSALPLLYQHETKMSDNNKAGGGLELAQIGWVVPDIHAAVHFLSKSLGVSDFPKPQHVKAQDLNMTYYGEVVDAEWLTTQTYNGGIFIELVQPLSGQSMFQDYLKKYPSGGIQHNAFRLPVSSFEQTTNDLRKQGYAVISEVDHPIARMAFFDTYKTLGVATEIMGITPDGWRVIGQMQNVGKES